MKTNLQPPTLLTNTPPQSPSSASMPISISISKNNKIPVYNAIFNSHNNNSNNNNNNNNKTSDNVNRYRINTSNSNSLPISPSSSTQKINHDNSGFNMNNVNNVNSVNSYCTIGN